MQPPCLPHRYKCDQNIINTPQWHFLCDVQKLIVMADMHHENVSDACFQLKKVSLVAIKLTQLILNQVLTAVGKKYWTIKFTKSQCVRENKHKKFKKKFV